MTRSRFLVFVIIVLGWTILPTAETWTVYVSVGAFRIKKNAIALKKELSEKWHDTNIIIKKQHRLNRVLVGPFRNDAEAEIYQIKLHTMDYPAVILHY
ncbi:MAG: SPOR domain-containing protein [Bdellovibrionales bacterium]|nr:SPOR domain-containing protein [Bdellovibrionales bacterium]